MRVTRVVVCPAVPEQGVLFPVGLRVPRRHLTGEPAQPLLRPVRVLRRAGGDLRPVHRHGAHLAHAQPGAQHQHLREQSRRGVRELLPEPGDRHVIRQLPGADHPERHIPRAQPLDPPRGRHPVRIRPDQHRHHHVRVITRGARPAHLAARMQRRGIQQRDRLDHQPHRICGRQPVPHIRREKKRLIPVNPAVTLRHNPTLSRPRHTRTRTRRFRNSPLRGQIPSTNAKQPMCLT